MSGVGSTEPPGSAGYEILSIDELERLPTTQGSQLLLPLRRTVGFRPFGLNVWVGAQPGDHVIERHREQNGDEELYVVLRGTAQFTLGDDTFEAPAGTLVHAPPGTLREATALEPETTVLAMGAKEGEAFTPSPWEDCYVAYAYLRAGEPERGRAALQEALARDPVAWQGQYNAACFEALAGNVDAALDYLRTAVAGDRAAVLEIADGDSDLDALRDDPRYADILTGGVGSTEPLKNGGAGSAGAGVGN